VELIRTPSLPALVTLAAVLALAVAGAARHRRRRPELAVALAATLAAAVGGTILAARVPATIISALALHNQLWLWPVSALVWTVAMIGAAGLAAERIGLREWQDRSSVMPTHLAAGLVGLVVVAAASFGTPHRVAHRSAHQVYVRALHEQAAPQLDPARSYRMGLGGAFETYGQAVGLMYLFERDGFEVLADDEELRRTFGDRRLDPDDPVAGTLLLTVGRGEPAPAPGAEQLAVHRPDPDLLSRRDAAETALVEVILRMQPDPEQMVGLTSYERGEVERWVAGDFPALAGLRFLPDELLRSPEVAELVSVLNEPVRFLALSLVPEA
jgi:hypothetical protein